MLPLPTEFNSKMSQKLDGLQLNLLIFFPFPNHSTVESSGMLKMNLSIKTLSRKLMPLLSLVDFPLKKYSSSTSCMSTPPLKLALPFWSEQQKERFFTEEILILRCTNFSQNYLQMSNTTEEIKKYIVLIQLLEVLLH